MEIHNIYINTINDMLQEEQSVELLLEAMKMDNRSGVQKLLEKYYRNQAAICKKNEKAELMIFEERKLWEQGYTLIGGIDEVGRGPLAGPVVAACVVLPPGLIIDGVDDSKKLSPTKREELFDIITNEAESIGIGLIDHIRIDKINIYNATIEAMIQAIDACSREKTPEYLLIDAMQLRTIAIPQLSIIGGDGKSQSIAAASIIAKVTRDRMMVGLSLVYPGYGFEKHKGYGTEEHISAIKEIGLSPIHRRSFTGKITL